MLSADSYSSWPVRSADIKLVSMYAWTKIKKLDERLGNSRALIVACSLSVFAPRFSPPPPCLENVAFTPPRMTSLESDDLLCRSVDQSTLQATLKIEDYCEEF